MYLMLSSRISPSIIVERLLTPGKSYTLLRHINSSRYNQSKIIKSFLETVARAASNKYEIYDDSKLTTSKNSKSIINSILQCMIDKWHLLIANSTRSQVVYFNQKIKTFVYQIKDTSDNIQSIIEKLLNKRIKRALIQLLMNIIPQLKIVNNHFLPINNNPQPITTKYV